MSQTAYPPRPSLSGPFSMTALLLAALLVIPTDARAAGNTASLHAGAELANANGASSNGPQFGVAARLRAVFDISTFWAVQVGGGAAHHFAASPGDEDLAPFGTRHAFAGFRYKLDVFRFIPYVGLSAAAYFPGPPARPSSSLRSTAGVIFDVGVDWRLSRSWSVGVAAELHAVGLRLGQFPNYSTVGFQVGYHFRL